MKLIHVGNEVIRPVYSVVKTGVNWNITVQLLGTTPLFRRSLKVSLSLPCQP